MSLAIDKLVSKLRDVQTNNPYVNQLLELAATTLQKQELLIEGHTAIINRTLDTMKQVVDETNAKLS